MLTKLYWRGVFTTEELGFASRFPYEIYLLCSIERKILIQLSLPMSRWVEGVFVSCRSLKVSWEQMLEDSVTHQQSELHYLPTRDFWRLLKISSLFPQMQKTIHVWSFNTLQNGSGSKVDAQRIAKLFAYKSHFLTADSVSQKQEPQGWKAYTVGAGVSKRLPWLIIAAHLIFSF